MVGRDQLSASGQGRAPMHAQFKKKLGIRPNGNSGQPIQKPVSHLASDFKSLFIVTPPQVERHWHFGDFAKVFRRADLTVQR
jgi:hypothetical protein